MPVLTQIQPIAVNPIGNSNPFDFGPFTWKFLAQGDSWFSIGGFTTNMLTPLALSQSAVAVNCAHPGWEMVRMVDARRAPDFVNLLLGRVAEQWDAILLSGGGNDVIDFLRTPLVDAQGRPVTRDFRPLLLPAERGNATAAKDFVSETGWALFSQYLEAQYHELVGMRDSPNSKSQGVPIFVHTYDWITPRFAPALPGIAGPWLAPEFQDKYSIPPILWDDLSDLFIGRLRALIRGLALPNVFAIDTMGCCNRADPGTTGQSGNWANEIHPDAGGYVKLAARFATGIDAAMPGALSLAA